MLLGTTTAYVNKSAYQIYDYKLSLSDRDSLVTILFWVYLLWF